MARAMLRDDYRNFWPDAGKGLRLDDDTRTAVPTRLGYSPVVPGVPEDNGSVNPTVTIRERYSDGYDEEGNALWGWTPVVAEVHAVQWESRTETSDRTGDAVVVARFTLLYPADYPDVRETAVVESGGHLWRVTAVERFPDRIGLVAERIDDGA